jgi:hypothetical protein
VAPVAEGIEQILLQLFGDVLFGEPSSDSDGSETIRFGRDPASSALDVNCRAHEVNNLYVVDGSFFPSSAAVNQALTIIANALRVGDHLTARLS